MDKAQLYALDKAIEAIEDAIQWHCYNPYTSVDSTDYKAAWQQHYKMLTDTLQALRIANR